MFEPEISPNDVSHFVAKGFQETILVKRESMHLGKYGVYDLPVLESKFLEDTNFVEEKINIEVDMNYGFDSFMLYDEVYEPLVFIKEDLEARNLIFSFAIPGVYEQSVSSKEGSEETEYILSLSRLEDFLPILYGQLVPREGLEEIEPVVSFSIPKDVVSLLYKRKKTVNFKESVAAYAESVVTVTRVAQNNPVFPQGIMKNS